MIHEATHGNPSVVNYQIFVGAFSFLSLIIVIASAPYEAAMKLAVVLDCLNTLFFFAGGVALAARLGVRSCSNHVGDTSVGLGVGLCPDCVVLLLTMASNC